MNAAKLHHRGMEKEDVNSLIVAHDWLSGLANRDCDCYLCDDRTRESNPCDVCQARRAMDAINQIIDPRPLTLHPERLRNPPEKVYYELWEKQNERKSWLNSGFTLIEWLLNPSSQKRPSCVSQHDMTVATTVIQWLGTSCGRCFMEQAEEEIKSRQAERSNFVTHGCGQSSPEAWKARVEEGEEFRIADSIASEFISQPDKPSVHSSLRQAIINALVESKKKERLEIISAIGQSKERNPPCP